jgi:hypothetical protein
MTRKTAFQKDSEKIQKRIQHAARMEDAINARVEDGAESVHLDFFEGGVGFTVKVPVNIFTHRVVGRCVSMGSTVIPLFKVKDVK